MVEELLNLSFNNQWRCYIIYAFSQMTQIDKKNKSFVMAQF